MARFSLHAVAPNHPGLVAAVTQSLLDIGCNLEDSRMSWLRGEFSLVLVLDAPGVVSGMVIEEALAPLLEDLGLQFFVNPVRDDAAEAPLPTLRLSARGADRPGTVARVARTITEAGGDILELVGHVGASEDEDASRLDVAIVLEPGKVDALRASLDRLAAELEMHCDLDDLTATR